MLNRGMEERDQEGKSSLVQKRFRSYDNFDDNMGNRIFKFIFYLFYREPDSSDDRRGFYVSFSIC